MSQLRAVLMVFAAVCAGSCAESGSTGENNPIAAAVYKAVMEGASSYNAISETKALAICVEWPKSPDQPIYIDTAGGTYVPQYSDGLLPVPGSAVEQCRVNRDKMGYNCECTILDVNGQNRLIVPNHVTGASGIASRATRARRSEAASGRAAGPDTKPAKPPRPVAYGGITSAEEAPGHEN